MASTFRRCDWNATVRSRRVKWCTVWLDMWYYWIKGRISAFFLVLDLD